MPFIYSFNDSFIHQMLVKYLVCTTKQRTNRQNPFSYGAYTLVSAGNKGQEGIQNKAGNKIVQNGEEM